LRIAVHREIPANPELHRQWNAVALQTHRPQVFYTYEWALAVQAAYPASLIPLLLLGYEGGELIGVASLANEKATKNVTFLAATTADYCDFLVAPQRSGEFVDAVFAELRKTNFTSIALANLPADSPTGELLRQAGRHGFRSFSRPAYLCAQVDLPSGERRQELKTSLLNKKKLRRYLREMEREGPVTFVHLQSWAEIKSAFPGFVDAHVARFLATGRVSSLSTPERRKFLVDLARQFDGCGVVTLSMLKIQDRPVAWNYGFQFHGSWFWYQPTFDSRQEENSPGHCLLSRIVIEACAMENMNVLDLGLGAEGYKERFGNSTRQTLHVTLTRSSVRHLLEMTKYRTASELKKSPRLESIVRRTLAGFLAKRRR
jgi:CelD/BcsL family acetyltransferase involved in cellulose biosynthesis